ncbi:MAG: transferrin-binding protein-like solute binding protein [Sulfurimicrobium sp.]|nr:transferrin-binding protein-like solute binding protein [Sulfurimicrobium sp.]
MHKTIPFKLSVIAALTLSLAGCLGGGSNPVVPDSATPIPAPAPAPEPTPAPTPAPEASTANGVSVSMTGTYTAVPGQSATNITASTAIDINATLATTGTIGNGSSTGNVTAATITSINAATSGGASLTMTNGTDGVTINNSQHHFDAYNINDNGINGNTAVGKLDGVYAAGAESTPYSYMTFGNWNQNINTSGDNWNFVTGDYVYGSATAPANIPVSGTATYTGTAEGLYFSTSTMPFETYADMRATADFASRSLSFATTNTKIYDYYNSSYDQATGKTTITTNAVAAPYIDMSGTLTYSANSNLFTGSVSDGTGRSGTATGRFYGPAAEEIGGVYSLSGSGTHIGHFVGKK